MKHLTTKLAATLFILSGCAQNELVDSPNPGTINDGKVKFEAASGLNTRAANGNPFDNTAALQGHKIFNVSAYAASGTQILGGKQVDWNGTSWEYANEPYWPNTTVDFFAYANWGTAPNIDETGFKATSVTIKEDTEDGGQKDLLVAATLNASKQSRTLLNFKHALTQIIFKSGNMDDNLQVRIGGMRIVNVANTGEMTYLKADNTIKWAAPTKTAMYHLRGLEGASTEFTTPPAASAPYNPGDISYATEYSKFTIVKNNDAINNILLLIPQTFTAWNPNDGSPTTSGTYIEILAVVNQLNKVSTTAAAGDAAFYYCGTPVAGDAGSNDKYGKIYIPLSSKGSDATEWTPGKRITYYITFGDKNSGSGGGGYDDNGKPVLVPIRFNAMVEDWVDVSVPLLTASFEGNSSNVNSAFINGYTTQLLNDIAAARSPKTYKANIKISGTLVNSQEIAFSSAPINNFITASTVTYNFAGLTAENSSTITLKNIPIGWSAASNKDGGNAIDTKAAGENISIDMSTTNQIVLTKLAPTDGSTTTYTTTTAYINDYIAAIYGNETGVATGGKRIYTIGVTGAISKDLLLETNYLSELNSKYKESTVTIDAKAVTFTSGRLIIPVPTGWELKCGTTTQREGKLELSSAPTTDIVFTKY